MDIMNITTLKEIIRNTEGCIASGLAPLMERDRASMVVAIMGKIMGNMITGRSNSLALEFITRMDSEDATITKPIFPRVTAPTASNGLAILRSNRAIKIGRTIASINSMITRLYPIFPIRMSVGVKGESFRPSRVSSSTSLKKALP